MLTEGPSSRSTMAFAAISCFPSLSREEKMPVNTTCRNDQLRRHDIL